MTTKHKTKGDPNCEKCHGKGKLQLSEEDPEYQELVKQYGEYADAYATVKRCECLELRRFAEKVGGAVFKADIIEDNMLEEYAERNLFLQSNRTDFLAHLRSYLWNRPLEYYWRMTTDMDLIDIFLGKNEGWPSVSSYGRGPDLLIVQLGYQSYKNVALSGVVMECLKSRQFQDKPTWVVNPHELTFKEGHNLAWSPELEWYFQTEYKQETLKPQRQVIARPSGFGFKAAQTTSATGKDKGKGAAAFQDIDF
jgi:hypothetical protein